MAWPDLSNVAMQPTTDALHLWTQVVGKVRLMMTPWVNHGWHVPLYVSATGLTTGLIPAQDCSFEMEFNLLDDVLIIRDTDGQERAVELEPQSVADFFNAVMQALEEMGIAVDLDPMPCELPGAVPFHMDETMRPYDGEVARTFWRALVEAQRVLQIFRTRFTGKCSPIHFFWGSFDLAVTRFSGRTAPPHPGGMPHLPDAVAREAYSQEVSSAGFWPGGGKIKGACFYSYAYPAPAGFADAKVSPVGATFDAELGEFLLPYDVIFKSPDPDAALLAFLQSSYEAAANLAHWDRAALERPTGKLGAPPDGS